jgi:hypothetical protein
MTEVCARIVGENAVLPRQQFERLVELAERSEPISLQIAEDEAPVDGIMRLAEQGGAFEWLQAEDDIYTVDDLKVRYR